MNNFPEGTAIVYCQGYFNTTNGKTAHGLVRRSRRYQVISVVDARYAGQDAGAVLDGKVKDIPIYANVPDAYKASHRAKRSASHLVVGLAPDGGRLSENAKNDVKEAIKLGLNVDCGLHDFLSKDPEISALAKKYQVKLRDIRKTASRDKLHFFSGKIEKVNSLKVAVLGTDSAIGKRTTAWVLVETLQKAGYKTEMIGTGQTAWLQGAKYCIILDSLINDFVAGEIEHVIWSAWINEKPDVIIIEGQGSLMNPAYPGGFEILAAGRPDVIILQHAPARKEYDGFPGYPLHPLKKQIQVIELLSDKPVIAVTLNHENLKKSEIQNINQEVVNETGLISCDPLWEGLTKLVNKLMEYNKK